MKKNDKKNKLLEEAYNLFITKGYENTSVDEIISKVNIAKGTYYYYFESKEQMLEEVINMIISKEVDKAKQILNADIPIPNKIVGIIVSMRPNIDEAKVKDIINKPENTVMHEKINKKIIDEAIPLISIVINEGIKEKIFDCDNITTRIKMILIISNQLFDEAMPTIDDILVFIDIVEKILGAKKGTMSFIKELFNREEI